MHISEGVLTGVSFYTTTALGAAAIAWGAVGMNKFVKEAPGRKPLLGMAGAFIFVVSLVPIPAFMGTCSHPCGTPLAGILLGPAVGTALAALALFLQALLFAHGGFATLGANTLSLGLTGAVSGWLIFKACRMIKMPIWAAAATAGLLGDVLVYLVSGGILGVHLACVAPNPKYSLAGYLKAIYLAYIPVQGPIALGEMVVTAVAMNAISRQRPEVLENLGVTARKVAAPLVVLMVGAMAILGTVGLHAAPVVGQPAVGEVASAAVASSTAMATGESKGFTGMDEAVNEKMAEQAGAPAHDPYINLEKMGDVWNTILLLGGGIAGFIIGRNWHHLFGKPAEGRKK